MVLPCSRTDTVTALKNSCFILSERLNIDMIRNPSVRVHSFSMRIMISLSVNEILLPRYEKWSTNFRDLSFNMEMAPSCLNSRNFFIRAHRSQCLLLPSQSYAAEIRLKQVQL